MPRAEDRRAHELRELAESVRRRDAASAVRCYEEASNLLRSSPDQLSFAHTVRHLGDVYAEQGDWLRAESCYVEALKIYRSHPSPSKLDVANAIRSHAVLMTATGRRGESRGLWSDAGELYEALGITAGVAECTRHTDDPLAGATD